MHLLSSADALGSKILTSQPAALFCICYHPRLRLSRFTSRRSAYLSSSVAHDFSCTSRAPHFDTKLRFSNFLAVLLPSSSPSSSLSSPLPHLIGKSLLQCRSNNPLTYCAELPRHSERDDLSTPSSTNLPHLEKISSGNSNMVASETGHGNSRCCHDR